MDIRRPCMSWHELVCHMNLSNVWTLICGKHDSSTTDVTFWYMISKCSALSLLQTFWSFLGPVLKLKWISMHLHLNCCLGGGTFEEVLANINSPLIFELTIYLVWYLKVGFCICFFLWQIKILTGLTRPPVRSNTFAMLTNIFWNLYFEIGDIFWTNINSDCS